MYNLLCRVFSSPLVSGFYILILIVETQQTHSPSFSLYQGALGLLFFPTSPARLIQDIHCLCLIIKARWRGTVWSAKCQQSRGTQCSKNTDWGVPDSSQAYSVSNGDEAGWESVLKEKTTIFLSTPFKTGFHRGPSPRSLV